jgi:hypothetical protein
MTNGQRHWRDDRWLVVLFLLVSLVLLIASIAHASPCRPNGVDVTARLPTGSALQSFPMSGLPHTSSQSERDCLDLTSLDDLHALVIAAGDLAPTAKNKALDALTLAFTRILVVAPYRGALQSPSGGVWIVPCKGRLYQTQQIVFDAFRAELTSSSKRTSAAARFATMADLRNILDVDPTFTPSLHAPFVLPPGRRSTPRARNGSRSTPGSASRPAGTATARALPPSTRRTRAWPRRSSPAPRRRPVRRRSSSTCSTSSAATATSDAKPSAGSRPSAATRTGST